jgi:cellulose synthase (UDP-forming)
MGPETLPGYFKQQFRWAAGTIGVFKKILLEFFQNPFRLSASQWWEYFMSGSYYFIGWAFLLLALCPAFYLIFNVPTFFLSPTVYIISYLPYFVMTLSVFFTTMLRRHYKAGDIYRGMIMGSVMFPVLISASIAGVFGRKNKFTITPKGKSEKVPFANLWPWHLVIIFNLIAIVFGIVKYPFNPYAIGINIFWAVYHIFILSHIYYFNREPHIQKITISELKNG